MCVCLCLCVCVCIRVQLCGLNLAVGSVAANQVLYSHMLSLSLSLDLTPSRLKIEH